MFLYVIAWPTGVEFLMHLDNIQFIQQNISLPKIFMHLYNTLLNINAVYLNKLTNNSIIIKTCISKDIVFKDKCKIFLFY